MQRFIKILSVILVLSLVCVFFAGCKGKTNTEKNQPQNTTVNLADGGEENIDGTPIEVEPYETETGEPYVNDEGYPVYHVKNTYDEKGEPILVVKTLAVDDNGKVIFKIQKIENGVIKDAKTEAAAEVTTVFAGNSNNIPPAPNSNTNSSTNENEAENSTQSSNSETNQGDKSENSSQGSDKNDETKQDLGETIKLGGVWGNVTKYRDNIYRGTFVEKELSKLDKSKKYSGINAEFTRGIYIPYQITAEDGTVYTVKQVAYTRLYVYFDTWEQDYDWFTERGIFKPNMPEDPLVYIENNESFELEPEFRDVHTVYLIELSK